jgi:hypothetical protein
MLDDQIITPVFEEIDEEVCDGTKPSRSTKTNSTPAISDLAAIEQLDRQALIDCWTKLIGKPPPKYTSVSLMRRAIAFETQAKAHGGHSTLVRRALRTASKQSSASMKATGEKDTGIGINRADGITITNQKGAAAKTNKSKRAPTLLKTGTRLVREWNGRAYQVEVIENGFLMDGKHYRSLSAIAKRITSAHWSGPRFFGTGRVAQ